MNHSTRTNTLLFAIGAAAIAALAGCRGERSDAPPRQFFPDMDDQPKSKAQSRSTFFKEYTDPVTGDWYGRAMREPVRGTIAFGARPYGESFGGVDFSHRADFLKEDRRFYEGKEAVLDASGKPVSEADGSAKDVYLERMPIEVTSELLALGEKKFNIYCIVCHGGLGDGKGTVGQRWASPLPNWHDPQYQHGGEKGQDGYIFHTARYGVPNVGENVPYPLKMQGYATKLSERETWAIVAYIRVLQAAHSSPLNAVPERERQELERNKPAAPPPTSPAPAAAPAAKPSAPAPAASPAQPTPQSKERGS